MDMLRSCYNTTFHLRKDLLDGYIVEWYFARPGAITLPGPHTYGSLNWTDTDVDPGPGEIYQDPRSWVPGVPPTSSPGTEWKGSLRDFADGWSG